MTGTRAALLVDYPLSAVEDRTLVGLEEADDWVMEKDRGC